MLTLPLLDVKSNNLRVSSMVDSKLGSLYGLLKTIHQRVQGVEGFIRSIESECVSHFTRLNQLDSFCSGGLG